MCHKYIFFICDQPHTLKTARNNIAHSGFGEKSSRLLWNDGYYIIWNHISKLLMEDLECGLQLCPKVTTEHINLTPYSVMNVKLAARVLSTSVSTALKTFGPPEVLGTAKYCEMFHSFFDCLNLRNSTESVTKLKPFLVPYSSVNDERFTLLLETFLPYFTKWKTSIENRLGGPYTSTQKSKMFMSWQTYESIRFATYSTIELIKFLLSHNVQYVFTESLCQDPLENYFGRQRSLGRRRDNPNIRTFGCQDNTIRTSKMFKLIASGNSRDDFQQPFNICTEPVPCRKNKPNIRANLE